MLKGLRPQNICIPPRQDESDLQSLSGEEAVETVLYFIESTAVARGEEGAIVHQI